MFCIRLIKYYNSTQKETNMSNIIRFPIKKDVLVWAIENGDRSFEYLIRHFPKLNQWIQGEKSPALGQIKELSKKTSIPFGYFFLNDPPKEEIPLLKFRTINNENAKPSRALIDTIMTMEHRQAWMKDYLIENGQDSPLSIVNSFNIRMNPNNVASTVRKKLNLDEDLHSLTEEEFHTYLKDNLSKLGVMVMQSGIVGSQTKRTLSVNEFRAFVLIDDVVPLIFINRCDSLSANAFSLIHEFVHILIGKPEILNDREIPKSSLEDERWINNITARVLLPESIITNLYSEASRLKNRVDPYKFISRRSHVSELAVAIRLKELQLVNEDEVSKVRDRQEKNLKKSKGAGGDYYNTNLSRVDKVYMYAVIDSQKSGSLSIQNAAKLVGGSVKTWDHIVNNFGEAIY